MSLFALALLMAPHPKIAASKSADPTLSVTVAKVIDAFRPIALSPAPSGSRILASMEDGSVRIIDGKTRQTIRVLTKHPQPAYGLAWSPSGQFVATGDETARIWIENSFTGAKIREYRTHKRGIQHLSFNEFGNLLISTGQDDQVNVYDLTSPSPKEVRSILGKGMNFYGATFNPTSSRVFAVSMLGGGVREYDATTGHVNRFYVDNGGQGIWAVAYNPASTRMISCGRDGNCIVWDAKTLKKIQTLHGHSDWVVNGAISPNGKLAATSSTDRTVKVWNLQTMAKIADFPEQSAVGSPLCFTADGATLVSVDVNGSMQFNTISPAQSAQAVDTTVTMKHTRRARS